MKKLPNVVASTEVEKVLSLKFGETKINFKINSWRLETSDEFKETKPKIVKKMKRSKA